MMDNQDAPNLNICREATAAPARLYTREANAVPSLAIRERMSPSAILFDSKRQSKRHSPPALVAQRYAPGTFTLQVPGSRHGSCCHL